MKMNRGLLSLKATIFGAALLIAGAADREKQSRYGASRNWNTRRLKSFASS